ncbi:HipA domain-containing protein [Phyllobacterium sp. K27]
MPRTLDVYFYATKAGVLEQADDAQLGFIYNRDYLDAKAMPISISMPLREEAYADAVVRPYFSGLLPDERARRRLASALGVSHENTFGLLEIIGGECAGALSLLQSGKPLPGFSSGNIQPLGEKRLIDVLALLRERPLLGGEEGVRLSLAGAQDKLAVCLIDGEIALPEDGRPTTHILKPFIEGLDGTVENEVFCMMLAARLGLDAPAVSRASAGKTDFILVERYDRIQESGGTIRKLHQEDFCQALSVPPELKYEDEGGPGVVQSQQLIQRVTERPAADRLEFQRMLIFHYLVGNADAHAKNYALLYRQNAPELAPIYDVVCTAAYPRLSKNMAMKIGGRSVPDTIHLEQWHSLVPSIQAARRLLATDLAQMANSIEAEADKLLDELGEKVMPHPILKIVRKIIGTRAALILRTLDKAG